MEEGIMAESGPEQDGGGWDRTWWGGTKIRRESRELTEDMLMRMGIGARHYMCARDQIPDRCDYGKILDSYVSNIVANVNSGNGLTFWGDFGRGKTSAAVICLKAACAHYKWGLLFPATQIQRCAIKDTRFDQDFTYIERAMWVPLLVIDDLGAEDDKPFVKGQVEMLLRERYSKKKATIIATNLSPEKMLGVYGGGIMAIVNDRSPMILVDGHDWREANQ